MLISTIESSSSLFVNLLYTIIKQALLSFRVDVVNQLALLPYVDIMYNQKDIFSLA